MSEPVAIRKQVTFTLNADGLWTSKWPEAGGPVSHHELNQMKRVMMVGFRRQLADYKRARMAQQNA